MSQAAELLSSAARGRALFADSSRDVEWIHRLFDVAGLLPPVVKAFDALLDQILRPDADVVAGDPAMRNLAPAELQGKLIDAAYAYADRVAPMTHRAGHDAYYLCVVFQRAQIISAFGIDDLLADSAAVREKGSARQYKADHPDAVLSDRMLTPTRIWDGQPDIKIAFVCIPTIISLRHDHPAFADIHALLVDSLRTGKPLKVTIDWRALQLASVRWPNLAELIDERATPGIFGADEA